MSSLKELRWGKEPAPLAEAGRRLAAALLQRASRLLARLASGLASAPAEPRPDPASNSTPKRARPKGRSTWTAASSAGSPA